MTKKAEVTAEEARAVLEEEQRARDEERRIRAEACWAELQAVMQPVLQKHRCRFYAKPELSLMTDGRFAVIAHQVVEPQE